MEITDVREAVDRFGAAFRTFKTDTGNRIASAEAKADARLARIETMLRRSPSGGFGAADNPSAEVKAFRTLLRSGDDMELKALSVGSDPEGGYWVPREVSDQMVKTVFETTPMRQLANIIETSTDALEMIVDKNEAVANWVGETESRAETATPDIARVRIPVHELHAQPKATQKLLDDASINVEQWLSEKVAAKFARTEATAFVSGNGVAQPRGFLDYPTASTGDDTRSWGTLQYVASGAAGAFASSDPGDVLFDLIAALKPAYRPGAAWLMNTATASTIRKFKTADGAYIWQTGLQAGQPATLLGFPVMESEDMSDVAADSLSIAFGNWRQGYQIVDRTGIRVLRDPFTAKPFTLFDTTKRVGGDVVNFEAIKLLKMAAS